MTDKRRHSVAEIVPPTPHSKDKKKWSFDSFSPLHLGFTLPSKWKRKSSADGIDPRLRKHADDHDLLVKPSSSHRSKRRASVAVIATETTSTCTLEKSSHHHGSVLSLWRRRSSVQVEQTITVEQKSSPEEERPKSDMSRRRASIAVPHLHIPDYKITFKSPKSKSKKNSKEYFLAVVYLTSGDTRLLSGEDGIGIADLLTQATMDQRINSYRLIMASTRAILDSDGSSGSPCVDPDLEDVFDELGLQNDQEEEGYVLESEN